MRGGGFGFGANWTFSVPYVRLRLGPKGIGPRDDACARCAFIELIMRMRIPWRAYCALADVTAWVA